MKTLFKNLKLPRPDFSEIAAIGTWALVLAISLNLLPKTAPEVQANVWLAIGAFVGYLICFLIITKDRFKPETRAGELFVLTLQLLFALATMWILPFSFLPILTIIWAALLPHYFSIKQSVLITIVVVVTSSLILGFHWENAHYMFQGALYFTFHLFSLFMMQNAKFAEDATEKAQRLNQELVATQQLLTEASRQNERTRIARDLHDLLGHHLTALIINLQVASHLTEGEANAKITQCHSLAKLLLSDVRDAVSAIRLNHELDFAKMVALMVDNIPKLTIHRRLDTQLDLEDLDLAKALLSCIQEAITNSLRHSGASEFWISLSRDKESLVLELVDNGHVHGKLIKGNGLSGMQERVSALRGELQLDRVKGALQIIIRLPLPNSETHHGD